MKTIIDFDFVSGELNSIPGKRRDDMSNLGEFFAMSSIVFNAAVYGGLPERLDVLQGYLYQGYALLLSVVAFGTALLLSRHHYGMVLNGTYYAFLKTCGKELPKTKMSKINIFGVSTQFFTLSALIAGLSLNFVYIASGMSIALASLCGVLMFLCLLELFAITHKSAVRYANTKIRDGKISDVATHDQKDRHLSASIDAAHDDMSVVRKFSWLMMITAVSHFFGLGNVDEIARSSSIITPDMLEQYGPIVFTSIALVSGLVGIIVHLRLVIAVGDLSLQQYPNDDPFRLKMTAGLIGYCLIVVPLILVVLVFVMSLGASSSVTRIVVGVAVFLFVAAYPATLRYFAHKYAIE